MFLKGTPPPFPHTILKHKETPLPLTTFKIKEPFRKGFFLKILGPLGFKTLEKKIKKKP